MILNRFIVLDLDRTLLNTDAYSRLLLNVAGLSAQQNADLTAQLMQKTGAGFDLLASILRQGNSDVAALTNTMLRCATDDLLMPGAKDFITSLDEAHDVYGILTTGSAQGQAPKLAVFRQLVRKTDRLLPAEITNALNKSKDFVLNRCRPRQNAFYISEELSGVRGGCYARRVLLVDDKPSNLSMPHARLTTFCVPTIPAPESHTLQSVGYYIRHSAR